MKFVAKKSIDKGVNFVSETVLVCPVKRYNFSTSLVYCFEFTTILYIYIYNKNKNLP